MLTHVNFKEMNFFFPIFFINYCSLKKISFFSVFVFLLRNITIMTFSLQLFIIKIEYI